MRQGLTICVCVFLFLLLPMFSSVARSVELPARTYIEPGTGLQLPYRLFAPVNYDPAKQYPMVVYLHGAGASGLYEGLATGVPEHLQTTAYNSFLFVPKTSSGWLSYGNEPSDAIRMVLSVIPRLEDEFSIDQSRLYVTGLSMGGGGTWDIIGRRPGMFAAAVPLCGYGDTLRAPLLADQPVWAFHNADDPVVSVQYDRCMIESIRAAGGNPLYTEYPSGGHNIWDRVYADHAMWNWMFGQHTVADAVVPEPGSLALGAGGMAGIGCCLASRRLRRRRRPGSGPNRKSPATGSPSTALLLLFAAALLTVTASFASADVFNMPSGKKSLDFVTVGNPGNAPDTNWSGTDYDHGSYGAVGYTYQIGMYDVTAGQYTEFLNAVAKTDTHGLYNSKMAASNNVFGCNIVRAGTPGSYIYGVPGVSANRPVNFVSWGDAARFCNWLTNGQPTTGIEGSGTTEDGSYDLNGATNNPDLMAVTRKADARYVIPTENEWYKAAYYDPSEGFYWMFPTRSNSTPSNTLVNPDPGNHANYYDIWGYGNGTYTDRNVYRTEVGAFKNSASAYGTFDQGGNVFQWNETVVGPNWRGYRGGSFYYGVDAMYSYYGGSGIPEYESGFIGFRIASVPEPGSAMLLAAGAAAALLWHCRRQRRPVPEAR